METDANGVKIFRPKNVLNTAASVKLWNLDLVFVFWHKMVQNKQNEGTGAGMSLSSSSKFDYTS